MSGHPGYSLHEFDEWLGAIAPAGLTSSNGTAADTDWAALLIGAPEGQRHGIAVQIAGHYLGLRIAPKEVAQILAGYAARCTPPFPEREARELVCDLARRDRARAQHVAPTTGEGAETRAGDAAGLALVTVAELLGEPDDAHTWIVERRLPAGGLGLLAGKPKAGKSTAARCLALAVARGASWLGHATTQGPVIYLALEEKRTEVRDHFRALGATVADPIHILCESAPLDALDRLRREAERLHPVLIIIDPLFRFVRVKDGNDYATMTAALEPLLALARETGAHVHQEGAMAKARRLLPSPKHRRLESREGTLTTSMVLPRTLHREALIAGARLNWPLAEVVRVALAEWLERNKADLRGDRQ